MLWLGSTIALLLAATTPADEFTQCREAIATQVSADSCRCFYVAARRGADYERAAEALAQVAAAHPDDPWPNYVLADLYSDMADPRAVPLYRDAADGFAAQRDQTEAWVRMSLADAIAAGDPTAAQAQLERATTVAEASGDPVLHATTLAERARHSSRLDGDFTSVLVALDQAERVLGDAAAYQTRQVIRQVRATALENTGRGSEAIAVRLAMVDAAGKVGDVLVETSSLGALAELTVHEPGGLPDAIAFAERALELAIAHDNPLVVAYMHCLLGDLDHGEVRAHYRTCLAGAIDDPQLAAGAEIGLAWRDVATDPASALAGMTRAVALLQTTGSAVELAAARVAVAWHATDAEHARRISDEVLDELDDALARQRHAVGRAQFLVGFSGVYRHVAHRLATLDDGADDDARVDRSLAVIERWRGRVLTEQLDGDGVLRLDDADATVLAHRTALGAYELAHADLLASATPDGARTTALAAAEREVTRTWDAVLAARPGAPLLRPRPPTLAALREALHDDEVLVSLHGADVLDVPSARDLEVPAWAWVITRTHAHAVELPAGRDLADAIAVYAGAIERRDGSDGRAAAGLHGRLLAAPLAYAPDHARALVIIADGDLASLPFATLRDGVDGPVLAERWTISTAGSIATWLRLRTNGTDARGSVLVVAAPDPPPSGVGHLPFASREAEGIRERIIGRVDHVELATGSAATADTVRGHAPDARIVHFATHAATDLAHAGRQALALTPNGDDDGWLRPHDISTFELDGALVVLASCRSMSGAASVGEGPMGLGRAFLVAGARTVVATHWPVHDADAAAFSSRFYAALGEGRTIATAVSRAQQELRARGLPPAVWAAFTVLGDGGWSPITAAQTDLRWLWVVALAAAVIAAIAITRTRKVERRSQVAGAPAHDEA